MTSFTKDTFFDQVFDSAKSQLVSSDEDIDNDMGKRHLTFGIKKAPSPIKLSESSDSDDFVSIIDGKSDEELDDEIQEILGPVKDSNVIFNWNYLPSACRDSEWTFAYQILSRMYLKEHWVKTRWVWDESRGELSNDFTDTLNHAIVYSLVTLINPVSLELEVYKIVCKIPTKEARNMYRSDLVIPSADWILRSRWAWLSCSPYDEKITINRAEAIV
jgi:hypothetical protein